jgi:hypothetical protein
MPERFLGDWPRDAFIPFSQGMSLLQKTLVMTQVRFAGARACLGRRCEIIAVLSSRVSHTFFRFFETEGIAVMTMIVSKYKIEIKEEPEFVGETFEERYARVTALRDGLTTT